MLDIGLVRLRRRLWPQEHGLFSLFTEKGVNPMPRSREWMEVMTRRR